MYLGEPPWHGLGQLLAKPATAAEALVAARLDWEVAKVPREGPPNTSGGNYQKTHAVVRIEPNSKLNGTVLGLVDEDYTPLQNRDAFAFFDPIVGQGAAAYHSAGALGQGERIWIQAKLPGDIRVSDDDIVGKYLLLSNSHGGTGGVEIRFTPMRLVCTNMLSMVLTMSRGIRLEHTPDLSLRLQQAVENLGLIRQRYQEIEIAFEQTSRVPMNSRSVADYFRAVFPAPSNPLEEAAPVPVAQVRAQATSLFEAGQGNQMPGVSGTLWAAYNAVTELVDHRLYLSSPEARLRSIWFGEGYAIKVRAYELALQFMRRPDATILQRAALAIPRSRPTEDPELELCGV